MILDFNEVCLLGCIPKIGEVQVAKRNIILDAIDATNDKNFTWGVASATLDKMHTCGFVCYVKDGVYITPQGQEAFYSTLKRWSKVITQVVPEQV